MVQNKIIFGKIAGREMHSVSVGYEWGTGVVVFGGLR